MEISAGRATSIDKLPGDMRQGGSGEVVNEILHELNAPGGGGGGGGVGEGTQIFQRQTDGLVASPNEFAPQSQADMQEMQSQQMQQQQQMHALPQQESAAEEGAYLQQSEEEAPDAIRLPPPRAFASPGAMHAETTARKFDLVTFAKTILLFALVYMLFSLRYVKGLLGKIPTFSNESGLSVVGTVVSATVGGIIMALVQTFV